MQSDHTHQRIDILDGFRALAIISVLLYHFFSRWNDPTYPYLSGDYFYYGFKGVAFFFVISGFVISYTLENTASIGTFWKKRWIRLFPSMLVASSLTFAFILAFDTELFFPDAHLFGNYLISLTFLLPNVFDYLFQSPGQFSYLNYSYWSLWPEIQFYAVASCVYFVAPNKHFLYLLLVMITGILSFEIISYTPLHQYEVIQKVFNLFNVIGYLKLFLSGMLFYAYYKQVKTNTVHYLIPILLILVYGALILPFKLPEFIFVSTVYVLFMVFIHYPSALRLLSIPLFTQIGVASYFLYLVHEYIGVVVIKKIAPYVYPYSFMAPVIVILALIPLSILYTQRIEVPLQRILKRLILRLNK
jgi:peptidoglycan/LPS O-acetylase OafA/YrhL